MWRYAVGGAATLLLVVAGWLFLQRGEARAPLLPAMPQAQVGTAAESPPDAAPEATARTREQKRFGRYDKDRDGKVTREEYLASRHKAFAKLDTNGDGRLSFDEWAVKTTTRFAAADRDRSGAMDAVEFATTAPKRSAKPRCVCPAPAAAEAD